MNRLKIKGERKNLLENFLSLSVLQVLGYVFSLITLPYLAKTLGVANYGRIAFGLAVISYFQCIVQWGFRYSAVKEIAVNRNNKEKVSDILSSVLCTSLFLMLIAFSLLLLIVYLIPSLREEARIILFTALIIPGYTIFPDWLYQGLEKMKYITIMSFTSKLIFTIGIFVFIKSPDDYVLEPVLQAIGQFIPGLLSLIYAKKVLKLKFYCVGIPKIINTMKEGFNIFLTQFTPTLYNQLSIVLLGSIAGQTALGIFSAAYKFIGITEQFSAVVSRTFYPFLARRIEKHHVFALLSGSISLLFSIFLFVFSDLIINVFFTEEYEQAITILRILSFGPFFLFLRNTYGLNGLVLINKDGSFRNIILLYSILGLIFAFIAIPMLGNIGVAITFIFIWLLMGVSSYFQFKKYQYGKK